ncbi:hypothetical protein B0H19DRAFT_1065446 [Mycena capillaripes]|nr:hypothetical protein B0H19DRAFT_1065446 [Mycena capillaripes]
MFARWLSAISSAAYHPERFPGLLDDDNAKHKGNDKKRIERFADVAIDGRASPGGDEVSERDTALHRQALKKAKPSAGDNGKSTIMKQMRLISRVPFGAQHVDSLRQKDIPPPRRLREPQPQSNASSMPSPTRPSYTDGDGKRKAETGGWRRKWGRFAADVDLIDLASVLLQVDACLGFALITSTADEAALRRRQLGALSWVSCGIQYTQT